MQRLDFLVIGAYFVGMLAVGWYFSRRNKNVESYMLGGRNMSFWMVGLSLFASLFSALSYLAWPGEIIKYGPMLALGFFAMPINLFVVGWLIIPAIMKQRVTSAYELLEIRIGIKCRVLASVLFLTLRLVWMSVIVYMCSVKVVIPIMGLESHPTAALWVSIAMAAITIAYTSFGGLRAVVLTDVIQTFIMLGAMILSIILISKNLGGVSNWIPKQWPDSWPAMKLFDMKARTCFIIVFLSEIFWWTCTAGSDQIAIQRYLATKDAKTARKALMSSLCCDVVVRILLITLGVALLAYYKANPGLVFKGETISSCADKLFPRFIVIGLPAGITGLAIAGLLAAAMSSVSSGINSSCLVVSKDFVDRFSKKVYDESVHVKLAKIISLVIGVAMVLLSLLMGNVKGNLAEVIYKVVNLFVSPLFVPFFMALFIRRASDTATFLGMLVSMVVAILIGFSEEFFGLKITFLWILPGSFASGVIVSLILGNWCKKTCVPETIE